MRRLVTSIVGNNILANAALVAILVTGALALRGMVRESMPELDLNMIQITVPYPGADPGEVETGISRRIEAALDGMDGIKQYHTTSVEGAAFCTIEVAPGYDKKEMKDRIGDAVDSISGFPLDAETPRLRLLRETDDILDVVLWGEVPERQMKEWAERVRADLQAHPDISLVEVYDTRPYEISVEVAKERLLEYGLTLRDVSAAVSRSSLNLSSGNIEAKGQEISLRTVGRRETGEELRGIVVKALPTGEVITLGRVASVVDGFVGEPSHALFNGHPSAMVSVVEAEHDDSLAVSAAVRAYAEKAQQSLPPGLHITPCFDESEFIADQINMLISNGIAGLCLVLLVLWLFLNTQLSFWVAMGIPISLCGSIIALWLTGGTINQISLIAFIIVVGIIVDDAIVVGEAIFVQRNAGKPPLQAAVDGVLEVGLPVGAAVATTIAAFLPLGFVDGFMGQIMAVMPLVVIAALATSLMECLFILPAHLNHLRGPEAEATAKPPGLFQRVHQAPQLGLQWFVARVYAPLVGNAIRHRYVALCVALGIVMITAGALGGGHVRVVFWPPSDGNHMAGFVEFPAGTPSSVTRAAIDQTREALERVAARTETTSGKPLLRNVHSRVFRGAPHQGRVFVEMIPPSQRGVHSQDISAAWEAEVGAIPGALAQTFYESSIGVGGAPIELWLQGPDMGALLLASAQLKDKLREFDGVYQIADDFRPGKPELQVRLKPEANALGLTLDDVSRQLQGGYYGEEVFRIQRGREDVRVRVRFPQDERETLAELERLRISTPSGAEAPLLSVADVSYAPGFAEINGSNGLRRVIVTAAVDANKTNSEDVIEVLSSSYLDTLAAQYSGVSWSVRGAAEYNQQTMEGLKRGFLIASLVIFIIMATTFRSYVQPLVIMTAIPFGIIGAVAGHYVLGIPVTFLSLFGIIALSGIVVNDAIVFVECFNHLLAEGAGLFDALCRAGERRFQAIFLTTLTTCAGLMPLLAEKDLQAQIVIPMAASIAFGVAFSTLITLLLIPSLLVILNDARRLKHRLWHGQWPKPEDVEPGARRREMQLTQEATLEAAFETEAG